jgi:hypothetical protein
MPKSKRKINNNPMLKSMMKKRRRKDKDNPYFQRQPSKRERDMNQRSTKIFRVR